MRVALAVLLLILFSAVAFAQDTVKFDPSRDLDGFDRAAASDHRDLYPIQAYLEKTGQEMTPDVLAKTREQWKAERDAADKRIEAILADPREAYLYALERQFMAHPYFSKIRYDVDRSVDGMLFLVQRPAPGVTLTRDPRKIAEFYGAPMRRMEEAFDKNFITKLGLTRRGDYVAYTVCVLTDEDEYHAFGQTTEQIWLLSEAYYEPRLAVIVAFGDPDSPGTTPARQRRLVLSEFARALQHAYFGGRDDRPASLWLNLGFASWFGYREGVLADAQDKAAIDPDALAEIVKIAQDKEERELELHPLLDLVSVKSSSDVLLLAKDRAEAQHSSEPKADRALRAFYRQAELWVHFLHDSQGGRYREPFLKFFQSSMSGLGNLDAFYLSFRGVDLANLDKEFYTYLFAQHERLFPKVKLDRSWCEAPFANRVGKKPSAPGSAAGTPPPPPLIAPEPFSAGVTAVGPADVDGQHALALAQAMHGDLEGALKTLESLVPHATEPPESERIPREIERLKQFRLLRDGYFAHLIQSGDPISGKYRGQQYVAKVQKVEDGWIYLGENAIGLSKVPLASIEPYEIAKQAGRKEEQGGAEPWARYWPYVLVGEKKWEQLLKDDSEGAKSLREDARTWYPEVLKCGKAAVALNEIAAMPEPRNAKEAEKLFAVVKSLLSTYGDLPLVQRKMNDLRRSVGAVVLKTYSDQDPAKLCHGQWTALGNGLVNIVYEFAKPEELQDWHRVPNYLPDYARALPATQKKEEESNWTVVGGELTGSGSACYRHFADFAAPISVRYDVLFRTAAAKGDKAPAFTFMVGACDDGKGSYVSCQNFGGLSITNMADSIFKNLPNDDKPIMSKKTFKLELKNDGTTASSYQNGLKQFESPSAGLRSGGVFLWFHTDNVVAIQRLEIDARLDPAWPEKAKAAYYRAKLEELGFK